ncbi:MAG: hypothetical protein WC997_02850 [Porticoccaceae bacterium]
MLTYPGPGHRLAVKHSYNAQGYLDEIKNNASSALCYRATAMDARGNITGETHGNGLTTTRVYQAQTGYLQSVQTGNTPLNNRQNLTFTFDKVGNLIARSDSIKGFAETLLDPRDGIHRCEQGRLPGLGRQSRGPKGTSGYVAPRYPNTIGSCLIG